MPQGTLQNGLAGKESADLSRVNLLGNCFFLTLPFPRWELKPIGGKRRTMKHHSEIRTIAFVADYVPRKCGIATFTYDLRTALVAQCPSADCLVVAINDLPHGYEYGPEVRFEVPEQSLDSYARAADLLNFRNT